MARLAKGKVSGHRWGPQGARSMHRFVVGTGRCGSTLLSLMLRCNPEVLELSEFFSGLDWNRRFGDVPIKGSAFRELISAPHAFMTMVLTRGYRPTEVVYPFETPGVRYPRPGALPWILAATLPPLVMDPDALFDEVCEFADSMPVQPAPAHAVSLFSWLAKRLGRSVWVERSAGSITWMGDLNRAVSGARFVHIHRMGEEAALSMRDHAVFRIAVMLTYRLPIGESADMEKLDGLASDADHVTRLLASRPPPRHFGEFWTSQVISGYRALRELDADQYLEVRYEDLLQSPEATLSEIARFLDLPSATGPWRGAAAKLVRGDGKLRIDALRPEEREPLVSACDAGNRLLGRA